MKYFCFVLLLFICSGLQSQTLPVNFDKEPVLKWKYKTKGPVISSPVISENVVYFGGLDSTLYAIDLLTGNMRWTLKTNGEIRSVPLVVDGVVYLAGGNGVFSAIDKKTGKPLWRKVFDNTAVYLAERRYDFADYYHSSPVFNNGVIYFGSGNGYMKALNAGNGEILWTFKAGDIVHTTPVLFKDKIFFGAFDGFVYGLNAQTGTLIWKFKSVGTHLFPQGEIHGSLAVSAEGLVHAGSRDYNIYALDANAGFSHWTKKFDAWAVSHTVKDSVLYVGTSDNRVLVAYDAFTGQQLWKTDVRFNIFGGCTFSKSMVYVGTIWGKLYGVDAKTGNIKWSFSTDGFKKNHDLYYNSDESFKEDALRKTLKAPVDWIAAEYKMGGIFSTPAISEDFIVITTTEGMVYGLKRS